jgi:hypothetical protein
LDDNTKIYIECLWKGYLPVKIFIWMSHAKLPGVSALAVIAKLGQISDLDLMSEMA